ncbi:hypothetical protein RXO92_29860, partial [Pseudomonas aeruginosa]|nr:hypothetical protein [Pseudomonas aeruginosa]
MSSFKPTFAQKNSDLASVLNRNLRDLERLLLVFDAPAPAIASQRAGSSFVPSHPLLVGRDYSDSHPLSAITGLVAALAGKQPNDSDLTALAGFAGTGVPYRVSDGVWTIGSINLIDIG